LAKINQGLQGLVAEVTNRLRKSNKVANVIQVQLKSSDFQVFSKQTTLTEHIQNYEQIWKDWRNTDRDVLSSVYYILTDRPNLHHISRWITSTGIPEATGSTGTA